MGERDLGIRTSMQRSRESKSGHSHELGAQSDLDGTEHELDAEIDEHEDEDLAEAQAIDLNDGPEDDYVSQDEPDKGNDRPPRT